MTEQAKFICSVLGVFRKIDCRNFAISEHWSTIKINWRLISKTIFQIQKLKIIYTKLKWQNNKSLVIIWFAKQVVKKGQKHFKTTCLGGEIYNGAFTLNDASEEQITLKDKINKFNDTDKYETKPKLKKERWIMKT